MKRHLPADTEIYFRARGVADRIAGKPGPGDFGSYISRNSHAGRLISDLSSVDNAERMYTLSSQGNPAEGRRELQLRLDRARKVRIRRRAAVWSAACAAAVIAALVVFTPPSPSLTLDRIAPGSNKAVLVLADGTDVPIDGNSAQRIIEQKDVRVKVGGGELSYIAREDAAAEPVYNTVKIPRGGEHRITLSDGTRVWLNSESELSYPVPFNAERRGVTLSGEAYFEVAHDAGRPFVVESGGQTLTVLGTKFNVKAYREEGIVTSTLVEGSVEVSSGGVSMRLAPGTESLYDAASGKITRRPADTDGALSWKNGFINIEHDTLGEVLAKLSRWYDVDFRIVGDGDSDFRFRGDIPRNSNLQSVISILEGSGRVNFTVKGDVIEVRVK